MMVVIVVVFCLLPCVCIRIFFLSAAVASKRQRYYSCHSQNFWHCSIFSRKLLLFPHFTSFLSSFVIIFHLVRSFVGWFSLVRTPFPFNSTQMEMTKSKTECYFMPPKKRRILLFSDTELVMYTFDNNNSEKWDFMGVLEKRCLINDMNIRTLPNGMFPL